MSISLLYHAYGIYGVKFKTIASHGTQLVLSAEMSRELAICPGCGSDNVIYRGWRIKKIRFPPLGAMRFWLWLRIHRLQCRNCNAVCWPVLPFVVPGKSYSKAFAGFALDLLKWTTIKGAAILLGAKWDMIKNIHRSALADKYELIPLEQVRYLGIDEFSLRKGRRYMTIFVDLERGRIIHAVEGRSSQSVAPFIRELARRAVRLEAVATDLHLGYQLALKKHLPKVELVADRYHIVSMVNQAILEFQREHRADLSKAGIKTDRNDNFLLLKNYERLSIKGKERLDKLLEANKPLTTMHVMKEQLIHLWDLKSYERAKQYLGEWCLDAFQSGIKQLKRLAKTFGAYRSLILAYFRHPISTAKVEGINNKIKTLKRQAYGFRDFEYFKLRLYHLHEQKYSLSG